MFLLSYAPIILQYRKPCKISSVFVLCKNYNRVTGNQIALA